MVSEASPSAPNIMSQQPTLIIGLVGHQSHGKTTLANDFCGFHVFPAEPTTKLAFANVKLFKCETESCSCSTSFVIRGCQVQDNCDEHERCQMKLLRHISLVDCPGHPNFFPTVMGAIGIIDAALLLISAKESCGQPQTTEHLIGMEICSVPGVIIIQSNIDTISKNKKSQHYKAIKVYVKDSMANNAPVLEKGANFREVVCKTIIESVHIPRRNLHSPLIVLLLQSNNVEETSTQSEGKMIQVVPCVVIQGILKPNQAFEIRPGIVSQEQGVLKCQSLHALNVSIFSDETELPLAFPGGVIHLHMTLDPYVRPDTLAGRMLGEIGKLPNIFSGITVNYILLHRTVGLKKTVSRPLRMNDIYLAVGEQLLVIVGLMSTGAVVQRASRKQADLALTFPLCIRRGESYIVPQSWFKLAISWPCIFEDRSGSLNHVTVCQCIVCT